MVDSHIHSEKGFSLLELMIAVSLFTLVIAGVVAAFQDQLRSHNTQQRVLDMHQNARSAMYYMSREIRTVGLDISGDADAGIVVDPGAAIVADSNTLTISMDIMGGAGDGLDNDGDGLADEGSDGVDNNGNGLTDEPDEAEWFDGDTDDANEVVTYRLNNDADNDGICDGLPTELNNGTSCQVIRNGQILALNVDALNFVYIGENPLDPACDQDCVLPIPLVEPEAVRCIQLSVVARGGENLPVRAYTDINDTVFRNQQNNVILPAQNDRFRRLMLTNEIKCRNLGIN